MSHGKSSRSGSSQEPHRSGGHGTREQDLPSRPFSLPRGYYELYGLRPPESAHGADPTVPGSSVPRGLLEYYGVHLPAASDGAQGAAPAVPAPAEPRQGGQRKARSAFEPEPGDKPASEQERHERLDAAEAQRFGRALGADFSNVTVHQGDKVAEAHGAAAITFGNNVHFADGMREAGGGALLGHELVHTIQQGAVPSLDRGPEQTGSTAATETEADAAGAAAARGEATRVTLAAPGAAQQKPAATPTEQGDDEEDPIEAQMRAADDRVAQQAQQVRPQPVPTPPPSGAALPQTPAAAATTATPGAAAQAVPAVSAVVPPAAPLPVTPATSKAPAPPATPATPATPRAPMGAASLPAGSGPAPQKGTPPTAPREGATTEKTPAGPNTHKTTEAAVTAATAATAAVAPGVEPPTADPTLAQALLATAMRIAGDLRGHASASAQSIRTQARQQTAQLRAQHRQVVAQLDAVLVAQRQLVEHSSSAAIAGIQTTRAQQSAAVQAMAQTQAALLQTEGQRLKAQAQTQGQQKTQAVQTNAAAQSARVHAGAAANTAAVRVPVSGGGDAARSGAQGDASRKIDARAIENIQKDVAAVDQQNREAAGQFGQQTHGQVAEFSQHLDQAVTQGREAAQGHVTASVQGMQQAAAEASAAIGSLSSAGAERLQADHDEAVAQVAELTDRLCAAIETQAEATATEVEAKGQEAAATVEAEGQQIAAELSAAEPRVAAQAAAQAQAQLDQAGAQALAQLNQVGQQATGKLGQAGQEGRSQLTQAGTAAAQHLQQAGATIAQRATVAGQQGRQAMMQAGQQVQQQLQEATQQVLGQLRSNASQFTGRLESGAAQAQSALAQGTERALVDQRANVGQVQSQKQGAVQAIGAKYDSLKSEAESRSRSETSAGQKGVWGWIKNTWSSITEAVKQWFASTFGNWLGGFLYGVLSTLLALVVVVGILLLIAAIFTPFVAAVVAICLLVVGAGLGIYNRFQMFKAYNGRSPGLGEGICLVLLGVADVTGVPKIIEGLAGRRAFSNGIPMNDFESGESVGSGLIDLLGFIFLVRGIKGGLKGKPGEVKPGEVKPGEVKPGEPGRVTEPKKGVWEDAQPGSDPSGWKLTDVITQEGDFKVIKTMVEVGGKEGWLERAYNPVTKEFQMRNAFLEEVPKWVNEGTPMVDGKGTPTITWLTLRQMKLLGMNYAGAYKVKMSTIQNLRAIIQLHVLRMKGVQPDQAVLQTHSVQYAETTIVQSGHKVTGAKVTGDIWTKPLDFLMKHYESISSDPAATAAKHDQLIKDVGAGVVDRNTQVWMNYDIELTVEPFGGGTTGGNNPIIGGPGTGPSDDRKDGN